MTYDELIDSLTFLLNQNVLLNTHLGEGQKIDLHPQQEGKKNQNFKELINQQQNKPIVSINNPIFKGKGAIDSVKTATVLNRPVVVKIFQLSQIIGWDSNYWLIKNILNQMKQVVECNCKYLEKLTYIYFSQTTLEICEIADLITNEERAYELFVIEKKTKNLPIASMIKQLVETLHYYEQNNLFHGNFTLNNILIVDKKEIRLIDQGFCRIATSMAHHLEFEDIQRQVKYIAPEQFQTSPWTVKTDVYALGIILYEILTGKPSFHKCKLSNQQFLNKLQQKDMKLFDYSDDLPKKLLGNEQNRVFYKSLISKCIDFDVDKRPLPSEILQQLV